MILAGDIGGTHTRLALFGLNGASARPQVLELFRNREHQDLPSIVRVFLRRRPTRVISACFGLAGPVKGRQCEISNLLWLVDADDIAAEFGFESVRLVNDLEANALGLAGLGPQDFVTLNEGVAGAQGTRALIAAGTGLGEAGLVPEGTGYRAIPSEGGHADFGPHNAREVALLEYLLERFGHVSYERIISGPGLVHIYEFLRDRAGLPEPRWLAAEVAAGDGPAVISTNALRGAVPLAVEALDMFVSIYGAEAGNLALKLLATGGVYVGGGIAPKIIDKLREPTFMRAYTAKGRMSKLVEDIPVRVIVNEQTAVLGAARMAQSLLRRAGAFRDHYNSVR